jgi:hypothetical protein
MSRRVNSQCVLRRGVKRVCRFLPGAPVLKQVNHGASFQSVAVAVIVREWPSGSIGNNSERFLDFARNDRRGIGDIRTTIDESFRSSPQDELTVASLRKFSPVVFRPAVAGLLECARVLASL